VNNNYLYPDFHGVNWHEVRDQFTPMILQAEDNTEFYALLTEMVDLLGDEHSRFVPPNKVLIEDASSTGIETRADVGIMTAPTTNGVIIQHVLPGSSAEQAGLQPRDRIVAVDGTSCTEIISCTTFYGRSGTQLRLSVVRPNGQTHDVVLTRRPVEVRVVPVVRRLEGDIGYISIPSLWINSMAEYVSGALTDLVVEKPLRGLIIDLRGDPGGWRNVLVSVLSHFVRGEVGYFFDRHGSHPLIVEESSGPDLRTIPMVVLVDDVTASYAEVLAAILQKEANAYIIGIPSSGNTETIYAYELAGGSRLWLAQEGFLLRDGTNLEGQGVQPDLLLSVDCTTCSEENDPHINAALKRLESCPEGACKHSTE
jgi:C-terminal peptidase prc